jgi:phage gp36-like protein
MTYCSLNQLIDRYGAALLTELSFRGDDRPGEPDAVLYARVIADADALIDGYLFGRYALPLAEVPHLLVDLSQRIALYFAFGQMAPDKVRRDYEDAIKTLTQISQGVVRLNIAGAEPATGGGEGVITNEPERPLSAATLKGYI